MQKKRAEKAARAEIQARQQHTAEDTIHSGNNNENLNPDKLPQDDGEAGEEWIILERCTCGEPKEGFACDGSTFGEEVPKSLLKLDYNLTAEIYDDNSIAGREKHHARGGTVEPNSQWVRFRKRTEDVLSIALRLGYLGARWMLPTPSGLVEDVVETLEEGLE